MRLPSDRPLDKSCLATPILEERSRPDLTKVQFCDIDEEPTIENPRAILIDAAREPRPDPQVLQAAIATLEKQQQRGDGLPALNGDWRLIWTSGTGKSGKPVKAQTSTPKVIQAIDAQDRRIENRVILPFGTLTVAGSFEYSDRHRIEFRFDRLKFRLGNLPALTLPLGKWATGWLQTTYLDDRLHIERGDRGGVSAYLRT